MQHHAHRGRITTVGHVAHDRVAGALCMQAQLVAAAVFGAEQQLGDWPAVQRAARDHMEFGGGGQRLDAAWVALERHAKAARVGAVLAHAGRGDVRVPGDVTMDEGQIELTRAPPLEELGGGSGGLLVEGDAEHTARRKVELVHVAEAKGRLGVTQLREASIELRVERHRLRRMVHMEIMLLEDEEVVGMAQGREVVQRPPRAWRRARRLRIERTRIA